MQRVRKNSKCRAVLGILWKHQKCHRGAEKHAREEDAVVEGAQTRFSTKRNPVRGGVKDKVLTPVIYATWKGTSRCGDRSLLVEAGGLVPKGLLSVGVPLTSR